MSRNYLDKGPSDENYFCAKVYRDGSGNFFSDGNARWAMFDGQDLVCEEIDLTKAKLAFRRGDRVEGGIRLKDYVGINK